MMLVKNVEQIFSFVLEMMGTCIYFRVQLPALFLLFWRIVFIFLLLLAFFYFFFYSPLYPSMANHAIRLCEKAKSRDGI